MDFPWFKVVVVVLSFAGRSLSFPLACSYNGTSYKEGETVRTDEPCLSCTCQRGALGCSLRVCADYPDVLPPGCFLVHKPNDCCPQLFCEEIFNPIGVELRTGFQLESKPHGNDCVINGSIYAEGSAIASPQVCEYCYCVEGETKCIKPRCLQTFLGCKPIYEKSSCCPTHYDCREADVDFLAAEVKNSAVTVSNDSLRSLSNLIPEKENFTVMGTVRTDSIELEREPPTTTEEFNIKETTTEFEEESTTPATQNPTTLGFQTTETENLDKETTTITTAEDTMTETTTATATTNFPGVENQEVHIRSKLTLFERTENAAGSADNSSQEIDEYDSYDYSEPQLPPSLPNLVIFPFVAADAVVKDENVEPADENENVETDRIDAHPVFYKDYFSPPIKTEGGFVPKEPSKSDESFYEFNFFGKDQIEPPSLNEKTGLLPPSNENCISDGQEFRNQEVVPSTQDCVTCTCCRGEILCKDVECSSSQPEANTFVLHESGTTPTTTATPHGNPKTISTPDPFGETQTILRNDSTAFPDALITKKPVTVTYKNFILNFYPNYLVTTTRGEFKIQPFENSVSEEGLYQPAASEPLFGGIEGSTLSPSVDVTTTKTSSATSEVSFFDELLKSFLSNDATTAIATPATKRKYSSKIKARTTTAKPEMSVSIQRFAEKPEKIEYPGMSDEKTGSTTASSGALLKLAGCNIYGMMYRVGKVITELSGPCLECLCTDLGVQCRPLQC